MTKYQLEILETGSHLYYTIDLGYQFSLKDAKEEAEYIVNMLKRNGKDIAEHRLLMS